MAEKITCDISYVILHITCDITLISHMILHITCDITLTSHVILHITCGISYVIFSATKREKKTIFFSFDESISKCPSIER